MQVGTRLALADGGRVKCVFVFVCMCAVRGGAGCHSVAERVACEVDSAELVRWGGGSCLPNEQWLESGARLRSIAAQGRTRRAD